MCRLTSAIVVSINIQKTGFLMTRLISMGDALMLNEPRREKTGLWGFRPGPTQTGLYSHTRWLEPRDLKFQI